VIDNAASLHRTLSRLPRVFTAVFLSVAIGCAGGAGVVESIAPVHPPSDVAQQSDASNLPQSGTADTQTRSLPQRPPERVDHEDLLYFTNATLPGGGTVDVVVKEGVISSVLQGDARAQPRAGADVIDLSGHWIAPGFIDSHVHLVYKPAALKMAQGGVIAAVDQAAPLSFFEADFAPMDVIGSGPMVTAVQGYPTQSWGSGGYGFECADPTAAQEAVSTLHGLGARLIKLPVTSGPQLSLPALEAAVERAKSLGLKTSSHALGNDEALIAANAGADLLAHTPVGALTQATIEQWADRAVVSSLRAFGGSASAVSNLEQLRDAGAQVLYGTDFGNTQTAGIDGDELALMMKAGMSGAEILAAGTSAPAEYWSFTDLGALEAGKAASFLVLTADPIADPMTLASPKDVFLRGEKL